MNQTIQRLVQDTYGAAYRPHPSVSGARLTDLDGVQPCLATSSPVTWVDTAGAGFYEVRDPLTGSLYNPEEARRVAISVKQMRDAGVSAEDIGVITPYSAQRTRLRARPELQGVEVATVNAFQGREKAAVICSFVRSNDEGEVGFVGDPRRLIVAITRARQALWCIGDSATLATIPTFEALFARLEELGGLQTVWEPPWDLS